jgi:hypothetical protein
MSEAFDLFRKAHTPIVRMGDKAALDMLNAAASQRRAAGRHLSAENRSLERIVRGTPRLRFIFVTFMAGLLGSVAVVLFLLVLLPAKKCERCGKDLPKFRRKAMQGISTCPNCGCEVDHHGRKVPSGGP